MNNLYSLVVSLIGDPPNDIIRDLYYVLICWLIIYLFKIIVMAFRAMLNINN